MVNRAKKVRKNKTTRVRKKLLIIGTEGKNKTEVLYFKEMERKQNSCHIIFASGNETDPVNIVKNTIRAVSKEGIVPSKGDSAFSVFDLDVDENKKIQLLEAARLAEKGKVQIITSNPCFEVWYLEHFGYTSKPFSNSGEVIKDLIKHCPKYMKNQCDIELFYPLTGMAIKNCKTLNEFHKKHSTANDLEFENPRTDVYLIAELLTGNEEEA